MIAGTDPETSTRPELPGSVPDFLPVQTSNLNAPLHSYDGAGGGKILENWGQAEQK